MLVASLDLSPICHMASLDTGTFPTTTPADGQGHAAIFTVFPSCIIGKVTCRMTRLVFVETRFITRTYCCGAYGSSSGVLRDTVVSS